MGQDARRAPLEWLSRHSNLVVFAAYVVLAVIFFWPGVLPGHTVSASDYLWNVAPWTSSVPHGLPLQSVHPRIVGSNPQLIDGVTVFQPFLEYTAAKLPHIPLWNPYIMGGAPYLADMQSAIFSPFSLPAYLFPFWWSLGFIAVAKIVVAAFGAFVLGRTLTMGRAGAFLTGLVFGFGLVMVAWIPWPLTAVFPWIPWMLVCTDRLIRRPGAAWASALAALVAIQFFGGHPETSVFALLATMGFFAIRLLQQPGGTWAAISRAEGGTHARATALVDAALRPIVAFGAALVVGTAIAAIAILPFLELLRNSSDLNVRPRSGVHIPPADVFAAFLPGYFPGSFTIVTAFYAGALPLMLAVVALLRRQVFRITIALVGVLTVLVVLGVQPFFVIAGHLPGLDLTYLSRLTIIYLLCIALLAGFGLDDLMRRRVVGTRAQVARGAAILILVLPPVVVAATRGTSLTYLDRSVHVAWLFAAEPFFNAAHATDVYRLTALIVWLTVASISVVLLLLVLSRRLPTRVFALLALALVVGDLFQAGMGYNPAIPTSHAQQPVTPAIRFLQKERPARFIAVTPYGGLNPLPPDVNMRYGLYDLRGYDLPVITEFGDVWSRYISPATPLLPLNTPAVGLSVVTHTLSPDAMRIFDLFDVRAIMEAPNAPQLPVPGLSLAYRGSDARIYTNHAALPRTWVVGAQEVVPRQSAELTGLVAPRFDPRREVITPTRLANLDAMTTSSTRLAPSPGHAHISSYGAERVVISARSARASELVLSDTWYPGWRVTVNGVSEPVSRVDYLLRGVAIPSGSSTVVFTYDPKSVREGWIVSGLGVLAVIGALALARTRRSRPGRHARTRGRGGRSGPLDGTDQLR